MFIPPPQSLLLLLAAGVAAGGLNSLAGGGSLLSFPALMLAGVPAVPANATNSAALTPGALGAVLGLGRRLGPSRRDLWRLLPASILGSAVGAWLLIHTSARVFAVVVPPLLLLATTLLWQRPRLMRLAARPPGVVTPRRVIGPLAMALQLLISVYGGYFGAGMGIMMLAVLGVLMEGDLLQINAVRNWLVLVINLVAAALLALRGLVWPVPALVLTLGALSGGYLMGRLVRHLDAERLRRGVVVLGVLLTLWFTYQALRPLLH